MMPTLLTFAPLAAAVLIAVVVLLALALLQSRDRPRLRDAAQAEEGAVTFLFDDRKLVDATGAARELFAAAPPDGDDWSRLSTLLDPRFPGIDGWVADLAQLGKMERRSHDGASTLSARWQDGLARVTLSAAGSDAGPQDHFTHAALTQELDVLRSATDDTPFPMWQETGDGSISWCNRAYLDLVSTAGDPEMADGWPPVRLFDIAPGADSPSLRMAVTPAGDATRRWFDIETRPCGDGRLCVAQPADALVAAEATLEEFVNTLTKTFASLPIGLAVFNRARELTTFNPALMELTTLPAEVLVARPTLSSFLDHLRERRMMPEPKDYKSWRQQVSDLVTAARNGTYAEHWTLEGGQTYRVTGQPHPDGAVAFLFEDISDEIGLARRHRAEIETAQATLDTLPGAMAVFSAAGVLTLSNRPYDDLWRGDAGASVRDALDTWRAATLPSAAWDDIRAALDHATPREPKSTRVTLMDGRALTCRTVPLPQGATLVEFGPIPGEAAEDPPVLALADPARLVADAQG